MTMLLGGYEPGPGPGPGPGELQVRVQAQVMTWDDKFSGWVPLDNGGVSCVSLYQRLSFDVLSPRYDYVVESCRIVDKRVLLRCVVTEDTSYRQVMPTFHHWQIDDAKYGLKFLSSYEACQFHNKLRKAVEHLIRQSSIESTTVDATELEDDVFVPVTLPSSDNNNDRAPSRFRLMPRVTARPSPVVFLPYSPPAPAPASAAATPSVRPSTTAALSCGLDSSTVETKPKKRRQLAARYALLSKRESSSVTIEEEPPEPPSLALAPKKFSAGSVKLPAGGVVRRREQCRHCGRFYYVRPQVELTCRRSPEPGRCVQWAARLACMPLLRRLTTQQPDVQRRSLCRWLTAGLTAALLLPCLMLYWAARACHALRRCLNGVQRRHSPLNVSGASA